MAGWCAAGSFTWQGTNANWAIGWGAGGAPGAADSANLFYGAPYTNVQPVISDARYLSTLLVSGQNGALYNISGPGSLTVSNQIILSWGGTSYITVTNLILGPNAYFNLGNAGSMGIYIGSILTGATPSTPLMVMAASANLSQFVHYASPVSPGFTGGTILTNGGGADWVFTNGTGGNFTFGYDTTGTNPAAITLGSGGSFVFSPYTTNGSPQEFTFNNPVTVNNGLVVCGLNGVQRTNTHVTYIGNLTLGGLLYVPDAYITVWMSSDASTPPYALGGTVTLPRAGRAGLLNAMASGNSPGRTTLITGNAIDANPAAPTPLLLNVYNWNGWPLIISNTNGPNTYAGGTVVDYCGNMRHTAWPYGRIIATNTANLGAGPLNVLPGGRIFLQGAQNVTNTAVITVGGNNLAAGVVSVGYNGIPANLTNSGSHAVFAMETTGAFSAITNLASLGDGTMFLGATRNSSVTLAPANGTLLPCSDNIYRLGSGGSSSASLGGGTVNYYGLLGDYGGTALQVGQNVWHGWGLLNITNANTFAGPIDVWGFQPYANNGAWQNTAASSWLSGTAQLTPSTGSPFGYTNGAVNLHNCGMTLSQNGAGAVSSPVTKGHLTFEGNAGITVSAQNRLTPFTLGIDASSRTNGGILELTAGSKNFQGNERIIATGGGYPPGFSNGLAAPYLLTYTNASAWYDFSTYSTNITAGFVGGFSNFSPYVALPAGGGSGTEVVMTAAASITNDFSIWALKTTGALTNGDVVDHTITVGSGGVLIGGNISASAVSGHRVNLNFGAAEGILFQANNNTFTVNGILSGSGGVTVCGTGGNPLIVTNMNNNFTGTLTLNPPGIQTAFDSVSGVGALSATNNSILINGGMLQNISGDRLLAGRTIILGPLSGLLTGTATIYGRLTGPGSLVTYSSGTITLSNDRTQGQFPNDYAGGTRVDYGTALIVGTNVLMGSGDLQLEPPSSATLYGNTNMAPSAHAFVPLNATLNLCGTAPVIGNMLGCGNIVLGNGTGSRNDTALTLGGDNSSAAFNGYISELNPTNGYGKGSLIKTGTGTLTLSGTHTFTGPTTVNNGTLRLVGSLASNLIVTSSGTLAGYGIVGGSLTNSGTWVFNLSSATSYDAFSVTGNVNVAGATLVLGGSYTPKSNVTLPIIQAGSVSGTFAHVPAGYWAKTSGGVITLTRASGMSVLFR